MKKTSIIVVAALWAGIVGAQTCPQDDIDQVCALLAIPSTSRNVVENDRATYWMKNYLEQQGVWCTLLTYPTDGRKILYAATRKGLLKPDYILVTHLDVVDAPAEQFKPRIAEGRIYARGACDTKVNAFCGAKALIALKDKASIGCVFAADEEIGGNTTKYTVAQGYGIPQKAVIVLDAGSFNGNVRYACKGNAYYKITATGKSGHSSRPELCDNPIYKLAEAAIKIRDKYPHQKPGEYGRCASVTIIGAGDSQNRIPETASMTVNVRFVAPDGLEAERRTLEEITGLNVEFIRGTHAAISNPDEPEIVRMQKLMQRLYPERKVILERGVAGNDMRYYPQFGKPMFAISMNHNGGHSDCEWCQIDDIPRFTRLLTAFMHPVP